jgi:hypothetical protein
MAAISEASHEILRVPDKFFTFLSHSDRCYVILNIAARHPHLHVINICLLSIFASTCHPQYQLHVICNITCYFYKNHLPSVHAIHNMRLVTHATHNMHYCCLNLFLLAEFTHAGKVDIFTKNLISLTTLSCENKFLVVILHHNSGKHYSLIVKTSLVWISLAALGL